jgi:hypothetical protein
MRPVARWLLYSVPAVFLFPQAGGSAAGRELSPAPGLEGGLAALIEGVFGSRGREGGRIDRVVVAEETPERLVVEVSVSGELADRSLRGQLLGRDRKVQPQFVAPVVTLQTGSAPVRLVFEPVAGAAPGGPPEYLRLSLEGTRRALSQTYRWNPARGGSARAGGGSAPRALRVRLRPEPLAAALPGQAPVEAAASPTPRPAAAASATPRPATVHDHRRRATRSTATASPRRIHAGVTRRPSAPQRQALMTTVTPVVRTLRRTRKPAANPGRPSPVPPTPVPGVRGPGAETHDLLAEMDFDDVSLDLDEVTNVHPLVYRDENPVSGLFYFLPRMYHLEWLADQSRYNMALLYLAAIAPGSAGEVSMAASLTAGLDPAEIRFAEELLRAYCRRRGFKFVQLRPVPIDPGRVSVSLAGTLRLFDIPAEKVAPAGISDVLGELEVAWVTDPVSKENVQLVMKQGGLHGNVTFASPGDDQTAHLVDLQIKLADAGSFERSRWRRGERWRNPTPYPVRLRYVHAVLVGPDHRPRLYSWNLGDTVVPPAGEVDWDAGAVPAWLDQRASRVWVSYAVDGNCESCDVHVLRAITEDTQAATSEIVFHAITALSDTGAYELALRVRSKHFDAQGRDMQEKRLVLKADRQDFTVGPIHTAHPRAEGEPLFEYLLTLTMPDGTEHASRRWIPGDSLRVLIGRSQLEAALGFVPGSSAARPPDPGPTPGATPEPRP